MRCWVGVSVFLAWAGVACRGPEFQTATGGADPTGTGAGASGGASPGGGGTGGTGGAAPREVLVEVVGRSGRPLADRPILVGDTSGETTQAGVTDMDGDLVVNAYAAGSITAILNQGMFAHTVILSGEVDHVRFVDFGGENTPVDVTIMGNCPDCNPADVTEYSMTCEVYRRELGQNVTMSTDFLSVTGCAGEQDVDVAALNYTTDGELIAYAMLDDVPFEAGTIDLGEFIYQGPVASVDVSWAGPTPALADDIAVLRFDGSSRTVLAKRTWTDMDMTIEVPPELLDTAYVSYRFDLDDNTFVFGAQDLASGAIVFETEELDTPDDASHEPGPPETISWSTTGAVGDAVELIITRASGGQLVWAPPEAEQIVLPTLPAPFADLATGEVTTIEVRNHAADALVGYGAFLADSTWSLRPNAFVAGRTFTLQ